jgi:hypothetical protein
MSLPAQLISLLTHPGSVVFAENLVVLDRFRKDDLMPAHVAQGVLWRAPEDPSRLKVLVTATGHVIFYGEHGQRILYLDPGGTPLHECVWDPQPVPARLIRARLRLDWGQWIGIKPEGLVNAAVFDLSSKPGWQRLTSRELQHMAARAMAVSPEDVAMFYGNESLTLDNRGQITIRHRKDALYVLKDRDFNQARFMACMGAMNWGEIDFLPVVELFQSLLAGTGNAVFELIRGLYDDQNAVASRLLRYRGIPTYPSPQAFRLFSTYFVPEVAEKNMSNADPFSVFMDPARSSEVVWRPRPDPPHRFIDHEHALCVTVTAGIVQKVTKSTDPTALPYTRPTTNSVAMENRLVSVAKHVLVLQDVDRRETIALKREWGVIKESPPPGNRVNPPTWRDLFPEGAPRIDAPQAYFAVPLYPEDDTMVDELSTQPLGMEQLLDYVEGALRNSPQRSDLAALIDQWDAVSAESLEVTGARWGTVLYDRPDFAQRQAQRLWAETHVSGNPGTPVFRFLPIARRSEAYTRSYAIIIRWIPFAQYTEVSVVEEALGEIAGALAPSSVAIVAGPPHVGQSALDTGLSVEAGIAFTETPGVSMLRTILPNARIRPDAFLYLLRRTRP